MGLSRNYHLIVMWSPYRFRVAGKGLCRTPNPEFLYSSISELSPAPQL